MAFGFFSGWRRFCLINIMANQTDGEIMCQAVGFWRLVRVGVVGESPRFGPATLIRLANCTSKGWKTSSHGSSDGTKTLRTNLGRTPKEPNERRGNVKCASRLRMWLNAFQICWYYPGRPAGQWSGSWFLRWSFWLLHSLFYGESVRGSVFVVKFLSALRSLRFSVREWWPSGWKRMLERET